MYPRFSETFIVSEILAHEAAGMLLGIFSLRPPVDTHFQDLLAKVRSPVRYIFSDRPRLPEFWSALSYAGNRLPRFWQSLGAFTGEDSRDVHQAVLLATELEAGGFTHVHAHFASVASSVARMAARFTGLPFSFTAHAKDIFHESVDAGDFRRKLSDASAVVTVSDHNLEFLRRTYGPIASRVRRIYNGLHLDSFPYSSPVRRDELVVAVGRLVEKKGFDDLIRALATLRDQGRRVRCEIIGAGDMEQQLRSLISHLALQDTVHLVGPLPQKDVRNRVRAATVLAAPCVNGADGNRDGLPTVLLEGMALGTPCISTDVAGIPEAVRHEETGLLVAERDVPALASGIVRLLDDAELRRRLAAAARRLVESDFDVRRNAEAVRKLFAAKAAGEEAA
ncbi:MAG TPA: glycosyltransferase family 4 protein [Gemmatimonadaceae bacterium]|nr:glycosyltransferase family 4 protein [Gemmatimonadaceae bacterium]